MVQSGAWFLAVTLVFCVGCSESERSGTNLPITIEPHSSVGKVHAGMKTDEVIGQLGQPERRTANALEYTRLGFAVMPGPDGMVQVVMCGDVTGINGPLVKAFTGRTKEGIGMQSSREELIKAYGEPTSDEKLIGDTESMRYDPLGITFTLQKRQVHHMIVRLHTQQEQSPSVTVDISPPPK